MGAGASAGGSPGEQLLLVGGGRAKAGREGPLDSFTCPITGDIMSSPVMTSDGHTYEKAAIEEWLRRGHRTSPLTGLPLESVGLTPNMTLKKAISEYLHDQAQQQHTNSSSVEAAKKRPPGMGMLLRLGSSSQTEQGESGAEQQQQKLGRALDRAAVKAEKVKLLLSDPDTACPHDWLVLQTKLPPAEVRRYASLLKRDGASSMALLVDAGYSREDLQHLGVRQPHVASLLRAVRAYKRQTGLKGPEDEDHLMMGGDGMDDDDPLLLYCEDEEERLRRKLVLLRRRAAGGTLRSQRTMSLIHDDDDEDDDEEEEGEGGAFDDEVRVRHTGMLRRVASSSFSAEPSSYARRSSMGREGREVAAVPLTAGEALRLMLREELEPSTARQQQLAYQQQQMREDEEEMQERVHRAFADSPALMRAVNPQHYHHHHPASSSSQRQAGEEHKGGEEEDESEVQDVLLGDEDEDEEDGDSTGALVLPLPSAAAGTAPASSSPAALAYPSVLPVGSLTVRRLVAVTRDQLASSSSSSSGGSEEEGRSVELLLEALSAIGKLACSMGPEPAAFVRMACHLRRLGMELQPDVGQDAHLRYQLGCAGAVELVVSAMQRHQDDARVVGLAMRLLARLMLDDDNKDRLLLLLGVHPGVSVVTGPMRRFPTDPEVQGNGCLILADLDGSCPCQQHAAPTGRWLRTEDMALILAALRNVPRHADVQVCGLAACARLSDQQEEDGDEESSRGRAGLFEDARELVAAARARFTDDQDVQLIARTVDQLIRQQQQQHRTSAGG